MERALRAELERTVTRDELAASLDAAAAAAGLRERGLGELLEQKLGAARETLEKQLDGVAQRARLDCAGVARRVAADANGARWLWRSGRLGADGWVPWEVCALNATHCCGPAWQMGFCGRGVLYMAQQAKWGGETLDEPFGTPLQGFGY